MRLHCSIKIGECRAGFDVGALCARLNPHILHVGQVDRESLVAYCVPGDVVATAANCYVKSVFTGEPDCMSDITRICTLHDHGWTPVNHGVPHLAGFVIAVVLGTHYGALDGALQLLNVLVESRCH